MKVLLATTNRGKVSESKTALADLPWQFITLQDIDAPPPPLEDARTFAENALLKARYYYDWTHLPALADDSGLCVDALGGEPGVETARVGDCDEARIREILSRLKGVGPGARTAYFCCAVCLYLGPARRTQVEGRVEGSIVEAPQGKGGFGLDPIFYYPPAGKTFAQLSRDEKNQISHRAVALRALRRELTEMQAQSRGSAE